MFSNRKVDVISTRKFTKDEEAICVTKFDAIKFYRTPNVTFIDKKDSIFAFTPPNKTIT